MKISIKALFIDEQIIQSIFFFNDEVSKMNALRIMRRLFLRRAV